MSLLNNEIQWDRLNDLDTEYNSFDIQVAVFSKFQRQKMEQYKQIFADVLLPFSHIEIGENIGEGKMTQIYIKFIYLLIKCAFIYTVSMASYLQVPLERYKEGF